MPPKTRGSKISRTSKENIGVNCTNKAKIRSKFAKLPRKALTDKTNSASDDNASVVESKHSENVSANFKDNLLAIQRPRRERRLPNRYVEANGIQNVTKSNNVSVENEISKSKSIRSVLAVTLSPTRTPDIRLDTSLTARRPTRICRLPSKFDNHSTSPSKVIPLQPAYASTPKVPNKPAKVIKNKVSSNATVRPKKALTSNKVLSNKKAVNKKTNHTSKSDSANSSADTNNNAKKDLPHSTTKNIQNESPKVSVPNTKPTASKKFKMCKDFSFKVLEDKKKKSLKRDASNIDIYEFTYDPNEEPPPQKKKRKKPTKKREPKPKMMMFKDNYDKNLAKALTALKSTISTKMTKPNVKADSAQVSAPQVCTAHIVTNTVVPTENVQPMNSSNTDKSQISMKNYNSVRVEDIALDFEQDNCVDDVNYSPVHLICRSSTPAYNNTAGPQKPVPLNSPAPQNNFLEPAKPLLNHDPLNLKDDLSFFDDQPVASSSMNVSARNPAASPWRVEFGSLPIKWQVNTYVKPNMTPAFESSFINFNDSKKKHVYTNMVPETNEKNDLPQVYEDYASKLKQTSIISFIKEVVEKKAKKKKDKMTPVKANSLFDDINNDSAYKTAPLMHNNYKTPEKNVQNTINCNEQATPLSQHVSDVSNESVNFINSKEIEKENSKESAKSSSKKKEKNKDITYFGFDDSENLDQENVSPVKKIDKRRLRALKPRSRAVLKEINEQKIPTRALLPAAMKSKPIQNCKTADNLFDQMKSANISSAIPEHDPIQNTTVTEEQNFEDTNHDSVHLFEDVEVVHHLKTQRKSYGKAKKAVRFHQNSVSDSDVPPSDVTEHSSSCDEDDLHDLTFRVPTIEPKKITRKKKPKKPKVSKKQEQEVEAWAAGFNSMCEDIEEFDLVVE